MTEPARQSKIHLNDDGSRKFKSRSLQQGVLDVRDLKLGETAHLRGLLTKPITILPLAGQGENLSLQYW